MNDVFEKYQVYTKQLNCKANSSIFLGFDYGTKRIGVSHGNLITKNPVAIQIIHYTTRLDRFIKLQNLIKEYWPTHLVVGLSFYSDNSVHELTNACRNFGLDLHRYFNLPVIWVDERYSSSDKNTIKYTDDISAQIILHQFLNNAQENYFIKE